LLPPIREPIPRLARCAICVKRWRDERALWATVYEHELDGVVAKRLSARYLPGERGWIETKNRAYWRYELEREGASRIRREGQFV
jgi:ATP-dependent DNA ligase